MAAPRRRHRASTRTTVNPLAALGLGSLAAGSATGQISFDTPTFLPTVSDADAVTAAGFNDDSAPDLLLIMGGTGTNIFENADNGRRFDRVFNSGHSTAEPIFLGALDLDGDHRRELLFGDRAISAATFVIPTGFGFGFSVEHLTLTAAPDSVAIGDFDRDGQDEFAMVERRRPQGAQLVVYDRRAGLVRIVDREPLDFNMGTGVAAGDFDGDGDLDLAVLDIDADRRTTNYTYTVYYKINECWLRVYMNDGAGQFSRVGRFELPYATPDNNVLPDDLVTGDFDNDGDVDLVVLAAPTGGDYVEPMHEGLAVWRNNGEGRFTMVSLVDHGLDGEGLLARDMDLDGDIDLVALSGASVKTLTNDGNGGFATSAVVTPAIWNARSLDIADVNLDGRPDLIAGADHGVSIYRNTTPYPPMRLNHTPLVRGQNATFSVLRVNPNETVHFFYSIDGVAPTVGLHQFGMISLDLATPIRILGEARAFASGYAEVIVTVPPTAPLIDITVQAAVRRGPGGRDSFKSTYRTVRIQE
ncbi:MAG: FG-GAP repeat domain-containing protein [Phycisphaerales bacterium]